MEEKASMTEFVESLGGEPVLPYQQNILECISRGFKASEAMRDFPHQARLDELLKGEREDYIEKCMIAAQTGHAVRVWVDDCGRINCSLENLHAKQHSPIVSDSGPGE